MNNRTRQLILIILIAAVIVEIIALNMLISRIIELRNKTVPAAKKLYKTSHTCLTEIAQYTGEGKDRNKEQGGILAQGDLNKLANQAGITQTPEFRQYPSRRNQDNRQVQLSEIKIRGIAVKPIFAFLRNLEEIGGSNRITELFITQQRGKINTFDLRVLFASYMQTGKK